MSINKLPYLYCICALGFCFSSPAMSADQIINDSALLEEINKLDHVTENGEKKIDESFNNAISIAVENTKKRLEQLSCLQIIYQQTIPQMEYYHNNLIAGIIDIFFISELAKLEQFNLSKLYKNSLSRYSFLKNKFEFLENFNSESIVEYSSYSSLGFPSYVKDILVEHLQTEIKTNSLLTTADQNLINDIFHSLTYINVLENGVQQARQYLHQLFLERSSCENIIFNKWFFDNLTFANKYGHEKLYKQLIHTLDSYLSPIVNILSPIFQDLIKSWLPEWQIKHLNTINEMINDAITGIDNSLPNHKWTETKLQFLVTQEILQEVQRNWDLMKHAFEIYTSQNNTSSNSKKK